MEEPGLTTHHFLHLEAAVGHLLLVEARQLAQRPEFPEMAARERPQPFPAAA
jgi:hypothetical protein